MAEFPNVPKAPPVPTPPKAPVSPIPTLRSATRNGHFFMEWVEPLERWRKYDDYGLITNLETAHLIIVGAEGVKFTPEILVPPTPSSLFVPELKLISPLGKGIITTNPYTGELADGQAVYIENVEFPITGNVTKNITVGFLNKKSQRRTDSIFLGVRVGDSLYFRVQIGTTTGGLKFKTLDAILQSNQSLSSGQPVTLPFSTTVIDSDAYSYDTNDDSVQVSTEGRYSVTYSILSVLDTPVNGAECKAYLQRNDGSGFSAVNGSYTYMNLDVSYTHNSMSLTRIMDLNSGDKIRVQAAHVLGDTTITVLSGGTTLTITKVG